jgi:hypothetical protein
MRARIARRWEGRSLSLGLVAILVLAPTPALPGLGQPAEPVDRPPVTTILLAGEVHTWLDLGEPPYNAPITIKMKLERAGFRVTLDPDEAYEAVLVINYNETAGREYRALEMGTDIVCDLSLIELAVDRERPVLTIHVTEGTSWPTAIGSLYWDAVQNFEENPYYYYLGDLVRAWLADREGAVEVFRRMVLRPAPEPAPEQGAGTQASGHIVAHAGARKNALLELGRQKDPRLLPTLWHFFDQQEDISLRETALAAIAESGDQAALDRLAAIYEKEQDPDHRAALNRAMQRLRQAR